MGVYAVLVGCNYEHVKTRRFKRLSGCHNDTVTMRNVLIRKYKLDPSRIVALTDKVQGPNMPTKKRIEQEIKKMVAKAKSGDALLFYFSGHGTLFRGMPCIVPADVNLMNCVDFREIVNSVPKGATFTIVSDSCNSGGLIDKEAVQIGPRSLLEDEEDETGAGPEADEGAIIDRMIPCEELVAHLASETGLDSDDIGVHLVHMFGDDASLMFRLTPNRYPPPLRPDQGILLSACERGESAVERPDANGVRRGVFTGAVEKVLMDTAAPTNKDIVMIARKLLRGKTKQHPCLHCSKENADRVFLGKPRGEGARSYEDDQDGAGSGSTS